MLEAHIRGKIVSYLKEHSADRIRLFGSYAREENRAGSDIDILVNFKDPISLLKLIQLQYTLEEDLGVQVDLVTENSLKNERLREVIYRDLVTLHDEKK